MERERLTIVHVTTFYPPHNFGGDGVHVQRLSRALARRGHRVSVVYPPAAYGVLGGDADLAVGDTSASADDVTVHRLPAGWRGALETVLVQQVGAPMLHRDALRRLLGGDDGDTPDVIHYHNVSLVGGLGVLALGDAIKLYTTHEYWLTCPTHLLFRYNREICTHRTCVRCTLQRGRPPQLWRRGDIDARTRAIDRFIFPSARTESVYRAQGITGAGTVMHHFLPDEYFEAAAARGARDDAAEPYFLYVGRMDAVKGVEALIGHFVSSDPGAPLFLVGDGPIAPDLRQRFGDHPRIRFLGSRSPDALGELYRDALALLLPSAGYEVFGLVVLEAFAHGTPAAVTDVTGAAELVRAAQGGFVYASEAELADALRRLSDPATRERLGAGGRRYAREAHRERDYVDRYEQLIREIRAP